jgi:hypothetical protein
MLIDIPDLIVERALECHFIQKEKSKKNIEVRAQLVSRQASSFVL